MEVEGEFEEGEEDEQVIWWVLEVKVEFKEEEAQVDLEVEVEFKEREEEDNVILSVGGRSGVQGGRGGRTDRFECVGSRGGVGGGRGGKQ